MLFLFTPLSAGNAAEGSERGENSTSAPFKEIKKEEK